MPGSYYSDVERTISLTYYILMEDAAKYDELFQQERKFISFEYYQEHVRYIEYDELVYGHMSLSELLSAHPQVRCMPAPCPPLLPTTPCRCHVAGQGRADSLPL